MPTIETDEGQQLLTEFNAGIIAVGDRIGKIENDVRAIKQRNWRPPLSGEIGDTAHAHLIGADTKFRDWLKSAARGQKSVYQGAYAGFRLEMKASPLLNTGGTLHVGTGVAGPPQMALRLVELIPTVPMTQGAAAEYAKETAFTPAADIVAEGALKPTTSIDFANVLATVKTIATITKVSIQSLADTPGLGDWLDTRLRYAVQLRAEDYLLNAALPDGLLANAQALSAGFTPTGTPTQLDVIGAAIGQLQAAGFSPNGVVLNGVDANATRLLKNLQGEYLWSSPDGGVAATSMWGVPVVISPSIAAGTWLVGAFQQSAVIFARQQLVTEVAFENEDDFTKNLACIRAEERIGSAVPIPAGLIKGTFTVAAAQSTPTSRR
jgi:hypothetical protein